MNVDPRQCHVALLSGGSSGEREISIASGEGAKAALEEAGFNVTALDPSVREDLINLVNGNYDVAFLCLHGKMGEDGTVQGLLEVLDIPYTCSGVQASAIAMDKAKSKIMYTLAGVPTPKSKLIEKGIEYDIESIRREIGVPCVVKPATEGSALGVEIVDDDQKLSGTIQKVLEIDTQVIVEQFVSGTEVTVAILGNSDPIALPVIKIVPTGEFYDFESKYAPGGSQHICPAPLDDDITAKLHDYAIKAHKALGCSGVSRSDFIIDDSGEAWILETNTIPGMTATSLLPDAAKAAGISFPELCTKLIEFALE